MQSHFSFPLLQKTIFFQTFHQSLHKTLLINEKKNPECIDAVAAVVRKLEYEEREVQGQK